jgi:hypothetical protein
MSAKVSVAVSLSRQLWQTALCSPGIACGISRSLADEAFADHGRPVDLTPTFRQSVEGVGSCVLVKKTRSQQAQWIHSAGCWPLALEGILRTSLNQDSGL